MLFTLVAALLTSLLFTQSAIAALTPDQVVTNIGIVTTISGNLNDALQGLTTNLDPDAVQTLATVSPVNSSMIRILNYTQRAGNDFQTIISNLAADVIAMNATPPFDDADALPAMAARDEAGAVAVVNALNEVSYNTHRYRYDETNVGQ